MKISIYSIGKTKESYVLAGETEYLKRVRPLCLVDIQELGTKSKESDHPPTIMEREAQNILGKVNDKDFLIVLDERGEQFSSIKFAQLIENKMTQGRSSFSFIIGGAFGLHEKVRKRADLVLSLSKMTFPHQLVRLFLIEQLYRTFSIMKGDPYHK